MVASAAAASLPPPHGTGQPVARLREPAVIAPAVTCLLETHRPSLHLRPIQCCESATTCQTTKYVCAQCSALAECRQSMRSHCIRTATTPPFVPLGWQPVAGPVKHAVLAKHPLLVQEHRTSPVCLRAASAPPLLMLGRKPMVRLLRAAALALPQLLHQAHSDVPLSLRAAATIHHRFRYSARLMHHILFLK